MRAVRLQCTEVAFENAPSPVQDHDAVGIGIEQRLRPVEPTSMEILEGERVDRRHGAQRQCAQIAWGAAAAPNRYRRQQFPQMRQAPADLGKVEEPIVAEADALVVGGRRPAHPTQRLAVGCAAVEVASAVEFECAGCHLLGDP